jgi:hypothetical protein
MTLPAAPDLYKHHRFPGGHRVSAPEYRQVMRERCQVGGRSLVLSRILFLSDFRYDLPL